MADGNAGADLVPVGIIKAPAELVHQGGHKGRAVGDATGDDILGPGLQSFQNALRANIGIGRHDVGADAVQPLFAGVHVDERYTLGFQFGQLVKDVIAADGCYL